MTMRKDSIIAAANADGAPALGTYGEYFLTKVVLPHAPHLDDAQAYLLSRSLEQEWALELEAPRPELPLATGADLLPLAPRVDDGAKTYHYAMRDSQGRAKWSAGRSRSGIVTSSLTGAEMTGRVHLMEGAYEFSNEDMRNARFAGRPIEPGLRDATLRAQLELQDEALAWGVESLGLRGLFNFPNISVINASADFNGLGIDLILANIAALVNTVPQVTNEIRHVTKVLMSPRLGRYLRQTRIGGDNGKVTLMSQIMEVFSTGGDDVPPPLFPIEFAEVRYLDATNSRSQGEITTDSLFAYIHNDARIVAKVESFKGRADAVQREGLMHSVPVESKVGGVEMPEPLTAVRMDGVFNG